MSHLEARPHAVCAEAGCHSVTYLQLFKLAASYQQLLHQNLKMEAVRGRCVAICLDVPERMAAVLAALREGCTFCLMDPRSSGSTIMEQLRLTKPSLLLATKADHATWMRLEGHCRLLASEVGCTLLDVVASAAPPGQRRSSIWTTLAGCSHAFKPAVSVALRHSSARYMLGPRERARTAAAAVSRLRAGADWAVAAFSLGSQSSPALAHRCGLGHGAAQNGSNRPPEGQLGHERSIGESLEAQPVVVAARLVVAERLLLPLSFCMPLWISFLVLLALLFVEQFVRVGVLALLKWLLIGRYKEGDHDIYSLMYLRHWLVEHVAKGTIVGQSAHQGSSIAFLFMRNLALKALGADVSLSSVITARVVAFDLVSVGDLATVHGPRHLTAVNYGTRRMVLRRVKVGAGAY
ncbi:lgrC, partial [Symbiodinium sp. KB8]